MSLISVPKVKKQDSTNRQNPKEQREDTKIEDNFDKILFSRRAATFFLRHWTGALSHLFLEYVHSFPHLICNIDICPQYHTKKRMWHLVLDIFRQLIIIGTWGNFSTVYFPSYEKISWNTLFCCSSICLLVLFYTIFSFHL